MPAIRSHHWPSSLSCSPPERPTERLALSRLLSKFATQPPSTPTPLAPARSAGLLIKLVAMRIPGNLTRTSGFIAKSSVLPPLLLQTG